MKIWKYVKNQLRTQDLHHTLDVLPHSELKQSHSKLQTNFLLVKSNGKHKIEKLLQNYRKQC